MMLFLKDFLSFEVSGKVLGQVFMIVEKIQDLHDI